jgi:hypothetical protein
MVLVLLDRQELINVSSIETAAVASEGSEAESSADVGANLDGRSADEHEPFQTTLDAVYDNILNGQVRLTGYAAAVDRQFVVGVGEHCGHEFDRRAEQFDVTVNVLSALMGLSVGRSSFSLRATAESAALRSGFVRAGSATGKAVGRLVRGDLLTSTAMDDPTSLAHAVVNHRFAVIAELDELGLQPNLRQIAVLPPSLRAGRMTKLAEMYPSWPASEIKDFALLYPVDPIAAADRTARSAAVLSERYPDLTDAEARHFATRYSDNPDESVKEFHGRIADLNEAFPGLRRYEARYYARSFPLDARVAARDFLDRYSYILEHFPTVQPSQARAYARDFQTDLQAKVSATLDSADDLRQQRLMDSVDAAQARRRAVSEFEFDLRDGTQLLDMIYHYVNLKVVSSRGKCAEEHVEFAQSIGDRCGQLFVARFESLDTESPLARRLAPSGSATELMSKSDSQLLDRVRQGFERYGRISAMVLGRWTNLHGGVQLEMVDAEALAVAAVDHRFAIVDEMFAVGLDPSVSLLANVAFVLRAGTITEARRQYPNLDAHTIKTFIGIAPSDLLGYLGQFESLTTSLTTGSDAVSAGIAKTIGRSNLKSGEQRLAKFRTAVDTLRTTFPTISPSDATYFAIRYPTDPYAAYTLYVERLDGLAASYPSLSLTKLRRVVRANPHQSHAAVLERLAEQS